MRDRALSLPSVLLGLVGLGLVGFETVQSMRSVAISTLGTILIFVGLGLFVLAAVLVVVNLAVTPETAPAPAAETPAAMDDATN